MVDADDAEPVLPAMEAAPDDIDDDIDDDIEVPATLDAAGAADVVELQAVSSPRARAAPATPVAGLAGSGCAIHGQGRTASCRGLLRVTRFG